MTDTERSADDVRRNFREVLSCVEHNAEHVTILRYTTPAAVLVPVYWYSEAAKLVDARREERRALLSDTEKKVWAAWNATDDEEPSPVKRIARQLGMSPDVVAFIVYPAETFGRWEDNQEPDLP